MQDLVEFFSNPVVVIVSGILTVWLILNAVYTTTLILGGVSKVWYRLGKSLSKRRIAIFADERFDELKDMLVDSGLFRSNRITRIDQGSIEQAAEYSLLLVHYRCFEDKIERILRVKKDSDALIVYAPQDEGFISNEILREINGRRNAIVVNMRGRLLNDVLVSMITTGYVAVDQ